MDNQQCLQRALCRYRQVRRQNRGLKQALKSAQARIQELEERAQCAETRSSYLEEAALSVAACNTNPTYTHSFGPRGFTPFADKSEQNRHGNAPDIQAPTVMVVDDNPINLEIACEILQDFQLRVITCTSASLALSQLNKVTPALIFMDIEMPVMTGLEAARILRRDYPNLEKTAIIAMTANSAAEDIAASLAAGMQDHLVKPLDVGTLDQALQRWLPQPSLHLSAPSNQTIFKADQDKQSLGDIPHSAAAPILDVDAVLKRLRGNRTLFEEVLQSFAKSCQQVVPELELAGQDKDLPQATRILHRLKGTAANLSALPLHSLAARLEQEAKQGRLPGDIELAELAAAIERLTDTAEAFLAHSAPTNILQDFPPSTRLTPVEFGTQFLKALDVDLGEAQDLIELFFVQTRDSPQALFTAQLRADFYGFNTRKLKADVKQWLEAQSHPGQQANY